MSDQLDRGSVGFGISIGLGLNVVAVVAMLVTPGGFAALPFLGLVQLLYLVPIALSCRRRQRPETMKGIIIIAAITFLLNAACDVMLRPVMRDSLPRRATGQLVTHIHQVPHRRHLCEFHKVHLQPDLPQHPVAEDPFNISTTGIQANKCPIQRRDDLEQTVLDPLRRERELSHV